MFHHPFSFFQRQRVAVARSLIMRPELVLGDKPTSALDVSVQAQILNLLMDLRKELGLTYVLTSHDLAVMEHLASKVAVMYLGRVTIEAETHLGIAFPNPIDPPPGCTFHPCCPQADAICKKQASRPIHDNGGLVECPFTEELCHAKTP